MASLQRTIKREMKFKGMNKQQRKMWKATHGRKAHTRPKHINADIENVIKGAATNG